ncbi:MAG: HAD family hydrolase [Candidatus Micrarchaeota archaeon]|nr:HAD family hydrolase [Candidatus Micrarchaeota archaeon]
MPSDKKKLMDHDLFVFDWDGTLNSMRLTMRVNEAVKRALHIWNKDSKIKDFRHVDYDLKRRLKEEEMKNDIMTNLFDIFLNLSRPKLHNDSMRLIRKLRGRGKKTAIFSNGRGSRVIRELRILNMMDSFDVIVSARDLHALKPNPTGLKAILNTTKVRPGRCIYIGDMVDDVITAKLANVHSCAVSCGFDSQHRLSSIKPDYLFRSIEDLYMHL